MATLVIGFDEFVGAAVSSALLDRGEQVYGLSLETEDTALQLVRKNRLLTHNNSHHLTDLGMFNLMSFNDAALHQAIQKVVFLPNFAFIHNNKAQLLADALSTIALCKQIKPVHLTVGSHYSVYPPHGHSDMQCHEALNHPGDLESATCRSMELLFHGLSASTGIPCSVIRLFDSYGQDADSNNTIVKLYSHCINHQGEDTLEMNNDIRDFVYINDVADGVCRILEHTPTPSPEWQNHIERADISASPYVIYNLGTGEGNTISTLLHLIRQQLQHSRDSGITLNNQSNKIVANITKLQQQIGFRPTTQLRDGLAYLKTNLQRQDEV